MEPCVKSLPITICDSNDNAVLLEIPYGKPDPHKSCTWHGDARDYVPQSAAKEGDSCYYTYNFLRHRIGKHPCPELRQARQIERACSQRRKALAAYDAHFPVCIGELYNLADGAKLQQLDRKKAAEFLRFGEHGTAALSTGDGRSSIFPWVKAFLTENKYPNFHAHLIAKRCAQLININMQFLKIFPQMEQQFLQSGLAQLDLENKAAALDAYVRDFMADLYGLHKSMWTPSHGIEGLISALKKNGPLMVLGHLGVSEYVEKPQFKNTYAGRDIYAWPIGAKRTQMTTGNAVLLVGAKKINDKGFVYLIDSADASSQRKIYVISFANLTSNINDLYGKHKLDSDAYAYHGHFQL